MLPCTDPAGCSLEGFHVNAVAAAVGAFFRELPTPLIPKDHYTDLLRTIGESSLFVIYYTLLFINFSTECMPGK